MVVGNKLFFGGPKLRQRVPLQPSHRRYVPSLLPDDAAQPPNYPFTGFPILTPIFARKLSVRPLIASTQVQHGRRHPIVPQHPYNVQTKSQAPEDHHHQRRIFCETGREGLFVRKMNPRSAHPRIASTCTSPGTFQLQGYFPPHSIMLQVSPGARNPRLPYSPAKEPTPSPPISLIRPSYCLRTTTQRLPTIRQPFTTVF